MKTEWGTVSDAARILGCTERWVQKLLSRGEFGYEMFGYQYRVNLSDVRKHKPNPKGRTSQNGKKH